MNNQQVFNHVVAHLCIQGRKSFRKGQYSCAYRGDNGLKCAIGALIPDALYNTLYIERQQVENLLTRDCLGPLFDGINPRLLGELQDLHDKTQVYDNRFIWSVLKRGADEIAEEFGLHTKIFSPHVSTTSVWRNGEPPHAGWWLCKNMVDFQWWRYWHEDGWWSVVVSESDPIDEVIECSNKRSITASNLQWSTYYPLNPRIPRLDPRELA